MSYVQDVMIKSPHAAGSGQDCVEVGKREKLNRYGPHLHELQRQNIAYMPAVFSAYGRRHPDVASILKEAAARVARRQGLSAGTGLRQKWARNLAVAVWTRMAAMVHRCLGDGWNGEENQDWQGQDDDERGCGGGIPEQLPMGLRTW